MALTPSDLSVKEKREVLEKSLFQGIDKLDIPDEQIQKMWIFGKAFIDTKNSTKLIRLSPEVRREAKFPAEQFLLLWQDIPVYFARSYTIQAGQQKQVVWRVTAIVANKRVLDGSLEHRLLEVIEQAVTQFGVGFGPYARGKSSVEFAADPVYIPDGESVLIYVRSKQKKEAEAFNAQVDKTFKSLQYVASARRRKKTMDHALNRWSPYIIAVFILLNVLMISLALMKR